jgi:hypothetical protein
MNFQKVRKMLKLRVTARQRRACIYLQRRGFVFCVDFGYENAQSKVRDIRAGRLAIKQFAH